VIAREALKLKTHEHVEEVAGAWKIKWSGVNNGPFFDLRIGIGFLWPNINIKMW